MNIYPKLKFKASIPKDGYSDNSCQDRYAVFSEQGKFAISDGATAAIYAEIWADILVNSFEKLDLFTADLVNSDLAANIALWLKECKLLWQKKEQELTKQAASDFILQKLLEGSQATFLGLAFNINEANNNNLAWRSFAIGDSCLFIVSDNDLVCSFPIKDAQQFSATPDLIDTKIANYKFDDNQLITGNIGLGSRCYLMTDALAQWFLEQVSTNQQPWQQLDKIAEQNNLFEVVDTYRKQGEIRNDDVALLIVECIAR